MLFGTKYETNHKDYVFVFNDRWHDGAKTKCYDAYNAGILLSSENSRFSLYGIFPNLAQQRCKQRSRIWKPPERPFKQRAKSILKKAKELQAMGIDRKTAIAAARKCKCTS